MWNIILKMDFHLRRLKAQVSQVLTQIVVSLYLQWEDKSQGSKWLNTKLLYVILNPANHPHPIYRNPWPADEPICKAAAVACDWLDWSHGVAGITEETSKTKRQWLKTTTLPLQGSLSSSRQWMKGSLNIFSRLKYSGNNNKLRSF